MPSLWTPQFDPTQHKVELPDLEEPKTDHFLRSVLQRKHQPLGTPLNLKLEFHGLFAAPEQWKAKVVSIVAPRKVVTETLLSVG